MPNAKLEELAKTNPKEAARKRRKAHMDSLRHARDRAEAKANSPIIEKESPLEEKVVSSTPVMRAPIAKQGTPRAREMVSTRCGTREVLVKRGRAWHLQTGKLDDTCWTLRS